VARGRAGGPRGFLEVAATVDLCGEVLPEGAVGCGGIAQQRVDRWDSFEHPAGEGQEGSLAQGDALIALAINSEDESAARAAQAIAERLGDLELRCTSLQTISDSALMAGDFDRACTVMDQVMALIPGCQIPRSAP
jgi:hypothetical protein